IYDGRRGRVNRHYKRIALAVLLVLVWIDKRQTLTRHAGHISIPIGIDSNRVRLTGSSDQGGIDQRCPVQTELCDKPFGRGGESKKRILERKIRGSRRT